MRMIRKWVYLLCVSMVFASGGFLVAADTTERENSSYRNYGKLESVSFPSFCASVQESAQDVLNLDLAQRYVLEKVNVFKVYGDRFMDQLGMDDGLFADLLLRGKTLVNDRHWAVPASVDEILDWLLCWIKGM